MAEILGDIVAKKATGGKRKSDAAAAACYIVDNAAMELRDLATPNPTRPGHAGKYRRTPRLEFSF